MQKPYIVFSSSKDTYGQAIRLFDRQNNEILGQKESQLEDGMDHIMWFLFSIT